jgi:protocatechuate 3,4-dioxygenase beta subunit
MNILSKFSIILLLTPTILSCKGQKPIEQSNKNSISNKQKVVGGGCDGCELMYVNMPQEITPSSTNPAWESGAQKLIITGIIFQRDGQTPAPNIIVYYWQTDSKGYYANREDLDPKAQRHGYIRGWVKTGADGKYRINTIRPAPYPNSNLPAHIHLSVKEPDISDEYYTDDLIFDDDKLLIPYLKRYPAENRGGSGILRLLKQDELLIGEHDIILGLNIPNYPKKAIENRSGLNIGEDQPSFTPYHAYGPDKGSRACPVCKYGRYHGIIYFVGNNPNWPEIKKWLSYLEAESDKRQQYLKAYFVYGNVQQNAEKIRRNELERLGSELNIKHLALTFVPSFSDKASDIYLNKINPEVENTFVIFRHRQIVAKYVELEASEENYKMVSKTLDQTQGDYFELKEVEYK